MIDVKRIHEVTGNETFGDIIADLEKSSYEERLLKIEKILKRFNTNDPKEVIFIRKVLTPFCEEVKVIYNK